MIGEHWSGAHSLVVDQTAAMEMGVFDQAADAVLAMTPDTLGVVRTKASRWGLKVWFDVGSCPREHYEAQVVGSRDVPAASVLALELGFHAEHTREPDNDTALAPLLAAEASWRKVLGPEPVAGEFLGRRTDWRRVSETWLDPDLSDPDLAFEVAARLVDYLTVLEPIRAGKVARRTTPTRSKTT